MPKRNDRLSLESKFNSAENDFNKASEPRLASLDFSFGYRSNSLIKTCNMVCLQNWLLLKSFTFFLLAQFKYVLNLLTVLSKKAAFELDRLKEKQESNSDDYLKRSLAVMDEASLRQELKMSKNQKTKNEFSLQLSSSIGKSFCTSFLNYSPELNNEVKKSITYDSEMISYMTEKMLEAKLALNVGTVEIVFTPDFQSKKVETTITFMLKGNGSVWSTVFSSFVMKEMGKGLIFSDGSIMGVYQHNATLGVETFSVLINHDLIVDEGIYFIDTDELKSKDRRIPKLNVTGDLNV